ncbi:MAG: hypothetical protein IH819_06690, partial [Bacteroidetes bacterium]|nr:hypothetical protein [Bacteroidota bacterium]
MASSLVLCDSGTSSSEMPGVPSTPGKRLGLAPGFEMTFPIHTNGTRPVN